MDRGRREEREEMMGEKTKSRSKEETMIETFEGRMRGNKKDRGENE